MGRISGAIALGGGLLMLGWLGCRSGTAERTVSRAGGDAASGRRLLRTYGCDTCHTIPGVPSAVAHVGPPLTAVARRSYLAGRLPNTPDNMRLWIRFPKRVDPQTAMPETGLTEEDARDIVAYLYTLE